MFIGRRKELKSLNDLYQKRGFSMMVITGRRRVGKSTLIREFIRDKYALYYTATRVGSDRNLALFSQLAIQVLDPAVQGATFPDIETLFDFITAHLSEQKRLILVIDELPYWAEKNEGLLSVFQKYIDNDWMDKNLFLILCGSSLSFMEDEVLSRKSPLFGRRDGQIHLQEFSYQESAEFVPSWSAEDKAICYGVTGGIAKYLSLFDPRQSLHDNIVRLFFQPDGYLYDEPHNLLTQEFNDTTLVNNVIEQIASGENTLNLISDKIHKSAAAVSYAINRLIAVGIVRKKLCITEENNRKKVQYVLRDHMFQFWFRFIPPAISIIELGEGLQYYDAVVQPRLHDYMGPVFEDMCQYFTLMQGVQNAYGCFLNKVGSWWGTERITDSDGHKVHQPADIDVVGLSDSDHQLVIGECKFRRSRIDHSVYDTLIRRGRSISSPYRISRYLLFSLSGYTEWFSNPENISPELKLYTLDDLYQSLETGDVSIGN